MTNYSHLLPGDVIYRQGEEVVFVDRIIAPNEYGHGNHYTGETRIKVRRADGTIDDFTVDSNNRVHASCISDDDGCRI